MFFYVSKSRYSTCLLAQTKEKAKRAEKRMKMIRHIQHFHPVLEKRYQEETKIYLWGDADGDTLVSSGQGVYTVDLKKTTLWAVLGGLVLWCVVRK